MSNLHLWLMCFRYTVEIKLHDGVQAVDTAKGEKEKAMGTEKTTKGGKKTTKGEKKTKGEKEKKMGTRARAREGKKKKVKTICGERHETEKGMK